MSMSSSEPKSKSIFNKEKKVTVRRKAEEIYPTKDGKSLLHPQFLGNKPIDKLFQRLEKQLDGDIESLSVNVLYERLISSETPQKDHEEKRYLVIEFLLNALIEIQREEKDTDFEDKNLIKISLHDLKTFGKIINLIVSLGVYPPLESFKIGIPLAKRELNKFSRSQRTLTIDKIAPSKGEETYETHKRLLLLVYTKLLDVFLIESDVKDLLCKGTGYSDFLTISIALITIPYFDVEKEEILKDYRQKIIGIPGTYELFSTFTLLVSTPSPGYFKRFVINELQHLHFNAPRNDGVLTLIEFVLGLRDNEEINVEKFDQVSNIILSKPRHINTVDYFSIIGSQFYENLIFINRPIVSSCIIHVLGRLWVKNKFIVQDFFLKKIWSVFNPTTTPKSTDVLVGEAAFNNNINVIISLCRSNLDPEILQLALKPIIQPLWSYFVFCKSKSKTTGIISEILKTYFSVMNHSSLSTDDIYGLDIIAKNLLVEGGGTWEYSIGENELPEIRSRQNIPNLVRISQETKVNEFLSKLEINCGLFVEFLSEIDDLLILSLFVHVLKRWLDNSTNSENKDRNLLDTENDDPFFMIIDLRLIETIGNRCRDALTNSPSKILDIIKTFLGFLVSISNTTKVDINQDADSDDEDDTDLNNEFPSVILELLSIILSLLSSSSLSSEDNATLSEINNILKNIIKSKAKYPEDIVSSCTSIQSNVEVLLSGKDNGKTQKSTEADMLDRILSSLNDPMVPVRAHGLFLLRQLIEVKSKVINIRFTIELHLLQLKDDDPYIYLNAIKSLESLIFMDPNEVSKYLLKVYTNEDKAYSIDERLRIGEVFLRYVQRVNELFIGDTANAIVSSCLSLVRRSNSQKPADDKIRMSSMSILGQCCKTNPVGIVLFLNDILDCVLGILQLERDDESAIMRRTAVVLVHDLITGTSSKNIEFPRSYQQRVLQLLKYTADTDNDLLVKEQANNVLADIDELVREALGL